MGARGKSGATAGQNGDRMGHARTGDERGRCTR